LWPDYCSSFEEVPADLAVAIEQALKILSWQENLTSEEMPPRWMWHLDWELETWFDEVKRARDSRFSVSSSDSYSDDDDETMWDDNEYASRFS